MSGLTGLCLGEMYKNRIINIIIVIMVIVHMGISKVIGSDQAIIITIIILIIIIIHVKIVYSVIITTILTVLQ